jgi:DNA-binding NarL/FixJ family response regulator
VATDGTELSPVDVKILQLMAEGQTFGEIGRQVGLRPGGVRYRVNGIKERWGIQAPKADKTQSGVVAVRRILKAAQERGIIHGPSRPGVTRVPRYLIGVARLIRDGKTNAMIATELKIAQSTVRGYVSRLLRAYEVPSRKALQIIFKEHGLPRPSRPPRKAR